MKRSWKRDLAGALYDPVLPWTAWFALCLGFRYDEQLRALPTWVQIAIGLAVGVGLITGTILTSELRGAKRYRSRPRSAFMDCCNPRPQLLVCPYSSGRYLCHERCLCKDDK